MNLYPLYAMARHLLIARHSAGYRVHSPFMYHFITRVAGSRPDKSIMERVSALHREMLADHRMITVTDLGAGSATMRKAERRISRIAAATALPERERGVLAAVAASLPAIFLEEAGETKGGAGEVAGAGKEVVGGTEGDGKEAAGGTAAADGSRQADAGKKVVGGTAGDGKAVVSGPAAARPEPVSSTAQPGERLGLSGDIAPEGAPARVEAAAGRPVILELGTSLGISTLALALAAPDREVITVEGCPRLAALAEENLKRHGAGNATVLCMEFSEALRQISERGITPQLAFIDGNHRGSALMDYTGKISGMGGEMIIIADDIHMNRDMHEAWNALARSPMARASLEMLRMGILFCMSAITPMRYRIRH